MEDAELCNKEEKKFYQRVEGFVVLGIVLIVFCIIAGAFIYKRRQMRKFNKDLEEPLQEMFRSHPSFVDNYHSYPH